MLPSDAEELFVTKAQYEVFEALGPLAGLLTGGHRDHGEGRRKLNTRRRRRLPENAVKTSASVGKTQVAPRAGFALLS